MRNLWKIIIVLLLVSAVAAVVVLKRAENKSQESQIVIDDSPAVAVEPNQVEPKTASDSNNQLVTTVQAVEVKKLPTLIELGADRCVPCKMMMPIIEELTKEYAGRLHVRFYDVWKNPAYGHHYGIELIPTQIFLDPDGGELFRHQGFFPKKDILAKWKNLGFELE